ncbi:MAG: Hsp70 family protein, partial [Desulfobacterales bacterium]|nr:Hsp70 family protein [Desulfobacterales bacterium]
GISIDASHLLSDEQIEEAVREAEVYAEEDMKRRKEVEINIRADSMIRAAELALEEKEGKVSTADLRRIQETILHLKDALAEGESQVIREKTEQLRKVLAIDNFK